MRLFIGVDLPTSVCFKNNYVPNVCSEKIITPLSICAVK